MRRSHGIRLGTLILVVSLAMPAFAAPRDDSPFDGVGRAIGRVVDQIKQVLDLADLLFPPK